MTFLAVIAGGLALVAVLGVLGIAGARIERHGLLVLAWRFLTGHPWHGKAVTDAGWLRPGRKALTRTGHASRFHHRPRLHRTAMRSGPFLALVLIAWGLVAAWRVTVIATAAAVLIGIAFGTYRLVLRIRRRRHHRAWVAPLHAAAAPIVGIPVENNPRSWVEVAPDRSRAVLTLPHGWHPNPQEKDRLNSVVVAKTGMESPEVRWKLTASEHRVVFQVTEPPPHEVTLADVRDAIEKAPRSSVVLGVGRAAKPVTVSLATDSPHVAASMGTGGGKSTLARAILAPWLHNGGIGLVLDAKLISHPWVWGLPNCACVDNPEALHRTFCWLGAELQRRNEVAKAAMDVEGNMHGNPGAPMLIVAEELNLTTAMLREFWKDSGERGRSPALRGLDAVMFAGRAVNMHVLQIAQMLSARASGSPESRENAGIRIIARASQNNWRLLAPEHPYPGKSGIDGRVHVVASGTVRECQVTNMTLPEARQLALSGRVTPLPAGMPGAPAAPVMAAAEIPAAVPPSVQNHELTLSEAVKSRILPMTLAAARTARHRDPEFPKHVGMRGAAHLFTVADLTEYARSR